MKLIDRTRTHVTIKFTRNEIDRIAQSAWEWTTNEGSGCKEMRIDRSAVTRLFRILWLSRVDSSEDP